MSTELTLIIQGQTLTFGVPIPAPAGEANDGLNVGGEAEVFKDKVSADLRFRTLEGMGGVTITENVDTITIDGSAGGGGGGVNGPASSTNNAIARWDGFGGSLIQDSPVTMDDDGNISTPGTFDGRDVGTDGATLDTHVADIANPHATTAAQIGAIPTSEKGAANGVATLNGASELSASQIPSGLALDVDLQAHIDDLLNPHNVTAAQVGNTIPQWNANKLQNTDVDAASPTSGQVLTFNSPGGVWEPQTPSGAGLGDVSGPTVAVDERAARFDGITGKLIQNSLVGIDDSGNITTPGTVDGRDVSVDGTKLDGIETAAKDDQVITAGTGLSGGGTGDVTLDVIYGTVANTATEGDDARVPTQDENDALIGTDGTPSSANRFVTNSDTRNTNDRDPNIHGLGDATRHSSATLAQLNALVSDATLIDTGDSRIPTQDENDALTGTSGSPSNTNRYVTDADPRITAISVRDQKDSVRAATTGALPANTRIGNVLTADANGVLPAQDGVTLIVGDRLLVQDESTAANNGIYDVTDVGSGATPFVLTRSGDFDSDPEVTASAFTVAEEGSVNGDEWFQLTTDNPIVINTTALVFGSVRSPTGAAGGDLAGSYPNPTIPHISDTANPHATSIANIGSGTLADLNSAVTDATLIDTGDSRIPSQDENDALVGTNGTPSSTNRYVTNTDPRNTDDRDPNIHGLGDATRHSSATLAQLNALVSDATLIDTGDTRILTQDENDAAQGTSGAPSNTNRYVTDVDPRNSDARTPTVHALGGAEHSADTLANLNTKVSDATLIDTGDSRIPSQDENDALQGTDGTPSNTNRYVTNTDPRNTDSRTPTGAAGGGLNGTYPDPGVDGLTAGVLTDDAAHGTRGGGTLHAVAVSAGAAGFMTGADKERLDGLGVVTQADAAGDTTTTSTTDVLLASMSITPGAGDYLVLFTSSARISGNNDVTFSVYVAGVQVTNSEIVLDGQSDLIPVAVHVLASGVLDAQAIEIRWRVSGGTGTTATRVLTVTRAG